MTELRTTDQSNISQLLHITIDLLQAISAKLPELAESQDGIKAARDAFFHAGQLASLVKGTRADLVELRVELQRLEATLATLLPHLPTDAPPLPAPIAAAEAARRASRTQWNAIVAAIVRGERVDVDAAIQELAVADAWARAALAAAADADPPSPATP